ncbi:MAG: hypothetical protein NZM43_04265 [Saprospiraceae bacterium]|nr:hypothetical protein [Saprospiraceae bacterium]MDW8483522.1 hypothetical protein [Saprospiraceae bacterium]
MFNYLRKVLLHRSLQRLVEHSKRRRQSFNFETARSIALLFDASEEETRKIVAMWAEAFVEREHRKRLHVLAFVDDAHLVGQSRFPQFTARDLRWYGRIEGLAVTRFLAQTPDLLLCFNPHQQPTIQWVAAASKASMKVGSSNTPPHDFDVVIETPADKDIQFFFRQVAHYLSKIVPAHYEQPA